MMQAQANGDFAQALSAGGEESAEEAAFAEFFDAAHQVSALLPNRSRMAASSAEITALPSRKRRPVRSTRIR